MQIRDIAASEVEAARRLLDAAGWKRRRKGVGRALVRDVIVRDRNMTWVLRAGRDGAEGIYEKIGFVRPQVAMEPARANDS